jgi:hypothetical protein
MRQRNLLYFATLIALAILAGYIYIYQAAPFSEDWNNILLYAADPFVTLLAAISVNAVLLYYQKDDKPYPVWWFFTVGMWIWFVAETIYAVLSFISGDVPPSGWADVFWFIGYGLISVALYYQYQLLRKTKNGWLKLILIWVGLILLTPLILILFRSEFSTENFLDYLYPIVDFAICIVSFRLYMVFGGGKLSRPWMGLFVLGISDAIWAWLVASGAYQNDSLSILTDASYVAAYLILALGFFRQYLLLRFGPE